MADIRALIVANLKTTLEGITVAGGYQTNLSTGSGGGGVHVWRPAAPSAALMPAVVIAAMQEQKSQQASPYYSCDLFVDLECFVALPEDDALTGWAKLEKLQGDVEKAVTAAPNRGQSGNTVVDTIINSVSVKPYDGNDNLVAGTVSIVVKYRHNWTNPGTAP